MRIPRIFLPVLALALVAGITPGPAAPRIVLWAWERPEDLRFVDTREAGIAFLAATARIFENGAVQFRPRTQRLLLPDGATVIAVVRIESAPRHSTPETAVLVDGIRQVSDQPNVRAVQIDFDARSSEHAFYRSLIESLRSGIEKPVTITALASWCAGDRWMDSEPIAEAVPMFFRMGRGENRDMAMESPLCRSSIGLSLDEPWPRTRPLRLSRIWLFSPRAWTEADYRAALLRVQEWR